MSKGKLYKDKHRNFLFKCIAHGMTPKEIMSELEKRFDISISKGTVYYYKDNYNDEIQEIRKELNENIKEEIPLANKGVRIKELQEAARRAKNKGDENNLRKIIRDIAEEMGDIEENINISKEAANDIMAAYRKRKKAN